MRHIILDTATSICYTASMSDTKVLPLDSDTPKQVSIATTLIPWRKDDNRAKYLGYLACGFNVEEALYMLGLKVTWLEEQRQDENFSMYELKVPEIRKELSREYIELDFFRNFRMVLEKDYRILRLALGMDGSSPDFDGSVMMSGQDHQYLLKMRSAYTPQQLQILEQVMKGVGAEGFNFAKFVAENQAAIASSGIEFSRTDTVRMMSRLNKKEISG